MGLVNKDTLDYYTNSLWNKINDNFVSQEDGKTLTSNDFSDEDKAKLNKVVSDVGDTALETESQTITEAVNELKDKIDGGDFSTYMLKDNPVGTGSLSMNRKADTTVGDYSVAMGINATASGQSSHAEGNQTTASGNYSHAEGGSSKAEARYAHAEGHATFATGEASHSEGYNSTASGTNSHAEGRKTTASKDNAHAEGAYTTASGNQSHAEGDTTFATGTNSHAEGNVARANGLNSHAEGYYTTANGENQHVQGKFNAIDNNNTYAHIVGGGTSDAYADRKNIHTLDWDGNADFAGDVTATDSEGNKVSLVDLASNSSSGEYLTIENPTGTGSLSLNRKADTTVGTFSIAVGNNVTASGNVSYAEGNQTTASGNNSHSEGYNSTASGEISHAEGNRTTASGHYSHAEGDSSIASGNYSHAEGCETRASGQHSHAEGYQTKATNYYSHAEGNKTVASGEASHAEGTTPSIKGSVNATGEANATTYAVSNWHDDLIVGVIANCDNEYAKVIAIDKDNLSFTVNKTLSTTALSNKHITIYQYGIAYGDYSHAEGRSIASGNGSHAEGVRTIASSTGQHVQGRYNIADNDNTYAHIVGGGTSHTDRKNIHTLDWDGNADFAGDVTATDSEGNKVSLVDLASNSGGSGSTDISDLTIKLNGGTTEGTDLFTFNGDETKTIDITPSSIGASPSSHTHSEYLLTSGGSVTGFASFTGGMLTSGIMVSGESSLQSTLYLGTNTLTSSDGSRYYLDASANARFSTIRQNGNLVLDTSNYTTYCAKASHTHTIANITNLQATLDGKANAHSHPYLPTAGGTVTGAITASGGIHITGTSQLANVMNLGTTLAPDNARYYINGNATGRFNALRYVSSSKLSSARRYKENIEYTDIDYWHDRLMKVKPCTFNFINDEDKKFNVGVIAEDLEEYLPEFVDYNENGECESVYYTEFIIPMLSEIQRLNSIIDTQQATINNLLEKFDELEQKIK